MCTLTASGYRLESPSEARKRDAVDMVKEELKEEDGVPRGNPVAIQPQIKTLTQGTSLVAQWLRILLPMQGRRVRALVWEDPTCLGVTKPVRHNY